LYAISNNPETMTSSHEDTIAGIATAPGAAGVAIIRISGDKAQAVADRVFRARNRRAVQELQDRVMTYGWIENEGNQLDEVMLCVMRKPHSFTAEDVVEIHCHGGVYLSHVILNLVLDAGSRLAEPGEFTRRAFLNGRIDLTQAEATNDIVHARSLMELNLVVNQLKGKLYHRIGAIKDEIGWILALVNADIDFPEEEQVFAHQAQIRQKLSSVEADLVRLIGSADRGMKMREGYRIVLTGKPNVGKSSILNGLLEESRAIVNQMPGTTRDTIEEACTIGGIPVSLIDTAGIHQTADTIEQEGIKRALAAIAKADLVLWVIDLTDPVFDNPLDERVDLTGIPRMLVLNKRDLCNNCGCPLPESLAADDRITISAKLESDMERLRQAIFERISGRSDPSLAEETLLTNLRQKKAAENALACLRQASEHVPRQHHHGQSLELAGTANVVSAAPCRSIWSKQLYNALQAGQRNLERLPATPFNRIRIEWADHRIQASR